MTSTTTDTAAQAVFSPIPEILDELRAGRMIVLTDDENRENEGDLILPAQFVTAQAINFMIRQAGGYLFVSLPEADCDRLNLHWQSQRNTSARGTPLTVTIDGHPKHGFTTGVAADERARTILMAIDPTSTPDDFVRPGHVNPLRSRDGGVLVRVGHTEGMVDLCRLAGLRPAAVGIEICKPDGSMARLPDLAEFCRQHGLKMCSIEQLIAHRLTRESLVRRIEPVEGTPLRTPFGDFTLIAYESLTDPLPHIALIKGDIGRRDARGVVPDRTEPVLVRMHRRSVLGDIFFDVESSPDGPSGQVLHRSMRRIAEQGQGVIVYLRPDGFGKELAQKLHTVRRSGTALDDDRPDFSGAHGTPPVPPHMREFGIGGQILRDLGLTRLQLITNRPKDLPGLSAFGLEIVSHVSLD